jgi:hypothetical protein
MHAELSMNQAERVAETLRSALQATRVYSGDPRRNFLSRTSTTIREGQHE